MRCGRRMPVEGERAVGREPPGPRRLLRAVGRPRPPSTSAPSARSSNDWRPRARGKGWLAGRNTISVAVSSSWEWTHR
jgi:hypothetical protein